MINPHAFPRALAEFEQGDEVHSGMSLRDYFAAAALSGMADFSQCSNYKMHPGSAEEIADSAYLIADAMLAKRVK